MCLCVAQFVFDVEEDSEVMMQVVQKSMRRQGEERKTIGFSILRVRHLRPIVSYPALVLGRFVYFILMSLALGFVYFLILLRARVCLS